MERSDSQWIQKRKPADCFGTVCLAIQIAKMRIAKSEKQDPFLYKLDKIPPSSGFLPAAGGSSTYKFQFTMFLKFESN